MKFSVSELKTLTSQLSQAIEKTNLNPKAGWVELEADNESVTFKVSNLDYYLEVNLLAEAYIEDNEIFDVTVMADTFIPLIAKLDDDFVDIHEELNSLILKTETGSYTFPIIKELGKTRKLDVIDFEPTSDEISIDGKALASIASVNTKSVIGSLMLKDFQQFIYVDEKGGITFTENTYVNNFDKEVDGEFKFLLTLTQAQLLDIFKSEEDLVMELEQKPTFGNDGATTTNKIKISNGKITLIMITQEQSMVDKFPSIRLRALAANELETHVVVDRKLLDKALARLMVFDKKFNIEVLDYSKINFKENEMELISIKNKNMEKVPYVSSTNVVEKSSMIRFADLVKQLKVINTKEIDISYNQRPVIVINNNNGVKQIIPECIMADKKV